MAQAEFNTHQPTVVAGSSRSDSLVLLCPFFISPARGEMVGTHRSR